MKISSILLVFLFSLIFTLPANAGSTWLRKRTFYVYEYIYDGEVVQKFEVPNRHGPSNNPIFFANCAINKINTRSDEEGRFYSSERVDIYCGKKLQISISGCFKSGIDKTNLFGETVVEAKDKSWVVFLPCNDGAVPGYAHLNSNGELSLVELSEFGIIAYLNKIEDKVALEDRAIMKILAINPKTMSNKRETAKLIVFKDGKYKIDFERK